MNIKMSVLGDDASQHYLGSQIDNKRSVLGQIMNTTNHDISGTFKPLDLSGKSYSKVKGNILHNKSLSDATSITISMAANDSAIKKHQPVIRS